MTNSFPNNTIGLYLHIPFCDTRCNYCHFYTLPKAQAHYQHYHQALIKELTRVAPHSAKYQVTSIYFGGGTPSIIDADIINDILSTCKQKYHLSPDVEITLEANPESITAAKLDIYAKSGINRLSIGLQAWQDRLLVYLGRRSTQETFLKAYNLVKQSDINNISIDLIFGIPTQTLEDWRETLDAVTDLNPNHISCYSLELDHQSYWGRLFRQGKLEPLAEETDRKMYQLALRKFKKAGFIHYEISNFSKLGYTCRHNYNFWLGQPYLGFGASAHSYFNNSRFHNQEELGFYIDQNLHNKSAIEVDSPIDNYRELLEYLLLRLRLIKGIDLQDFKLKFGRDFVKTFKSTIYDLRKDSLITVNEQSCYLTKKGIDVVDHVSEAFLTSI